MTDGKPAQPFVLTLPVVVAGPLLSVL